MIKAQRKHNFHARQPLGMPAPGIGPLADPARFRRNAGLTGGRWHPACGTLRGDALMAGHRSTLFDAWSAAKAAAP